MSVILIRADRRGVNRFRKEKTGGLNGWIDKANKQMEKYRAKYLKISTVAADLDFSTRTIRTWIYTKKIPEKETIKINGSWRISADWLYEYVDLHTKNKVTQLQTR